jgi:transposase
MSKLPFDLSTVTTVAVDLAKHVFQVHGCDAAGRVVVAKALRRKDVLPFFASLPACLIGMEACGSAHHWGRELMAFGHDVKLIPPVYVKPFVKRQKNDKNDAAAIYETLFRPGLRFVKVRSVDNQAMLMQHKVREMLVAQRTQLLNGLRGNRSARGVQHAQSGRADP